MSLIISARRSPIIPMNGVFKSLELEEICAPVIKSALADAHVHASEIDCVIIGNALSAGGNPARLCSLLAGIPESCPAITIDTQCCSGIDAIGLASLKIKSGEADLVLAGGVESYSRAPLRARLDKDNNLTAFTQAKFSPWHTNKSDILSQIKELSETSKISLKSQCELAIESHRRALKIKHHDIVPIKVDGNSVELDQFPRELELKTCLKINNKKENINPCLIANSADAAAILIIASDKFLKRKNFKSFALKINNWHQYGYDSTNPADIPVEFFKKKLLNIKEFDHIEWMESFAVQFLINKQKFGLPEQKTNPYGGMLAFGHPIGASGAILMTRLFHGIKQSIIPNNSKRGLALIPAVGGLVSAINTIETTI